MLYDVILVKDFVIGFRVLRMILIGCEGGVNI